MSFRVKHEVKILASLDADEKLISLQRTETASIQTIRQDLTEGVNHSLEVAAAAVDLALTFGGVTTAKILYIETDQELTLKINGSSDAMKLTPTSGSKAKLLWEGEFTSLTVSNPSADTAAEVTYLVAG